MGRVVVVGSSNTDLTMVCPRLPEPGETVLGPNLYRAAGGKGANQAVAAARAGAEVTIVCAVGNDDFGAAAVAGLKADGIDTRYVAVKRGVPSGVALIMVEEKSAENLIGVASGANMRLTPADVETAAPAIRRADVLLLQLEVPLTAVTRAAQLARRAGAAVVLNPAPMPPTPLPPALLRSVDYLVPNRRELERLTEGAADGGVPARLFRLGVKALIITLGRQGARVIAPNGAVDVPAFKVKPVDTVGAGDCFCGYLAAGIAEGMALAEAARLAAAAAAISVTRQGAQPSMPRRREVVRLLRSP